MANNIIQFKNTQTGKIRRAPIGFSWTMVFCGFFVMLFRQDWMSFFIYVFILGVLEIIFAIGTGVSWESLEDSPGIPPIFSFIYNIVWAQFDNDMFIKKLIEKEFKAFEVKRFKLEDVVSALGNSEDRFLAYSIPIMTESDNLPDKNEKLKEAVAELNKTKQQNNHEEEVISPSPSPKDTADSYQGTPLPDENRIFCGKCGKDNSKDNSFCTQCGKPLAL